MVLCLSHGFRELVCGLHPFLKGVHFPERQEVEEAHTGHHSPQFLQAQEQLASSAEPQAAFWYPCPALKKSPVLKLDP